MKIAFVGYKVQEKYTAGVGNDEDTDLLVFLQQKGLDITAVVWNDQQIDWKSFDVVIIKSPWDYHENITEFGDWLDKLGELDVKVLNPIDIIKWNSNKHYLKNIAEKGLNIIRSEYLEKGSSFSDRFFQLFDTEKLVVKPCVSAGAKNTMIVNKENFTEKASAINTLLLEEDYIVQPFVAEIKDGEWSFLFFNGAYSHCVLKTPKQDDFRVQHYHGGSISYPTPDPAHVDQASAYLTTIPGQTLYARVDGIIRHDTFELMELELIEPYLFLNGDSRLFENYYKALLAKIS